MLKLKLFAAAVALVFVGIVLSVSPEFATAAKTDVAQEIAGYKNWTRITKEPIRVQLLPVKTDNGFTIDTSSGGG